MALLMASSGTLPVLAASRTIAPSGAPISTSSGAPGLRMLAKQETDEKDKKKNKKKNEQKQQPQNQKNNKQQQPNNQQQQKSSQKERDRIYQEGLEKGKKKGYQKGTTSGYEEGFKEGKDKGVDKGYKRGYDAGWDERRAKDKDRWKDWDSNRWRDYNRNKRNVWTRKVVVNNNYYSNPGWARSSGWYNNRPWGGNWYGVSSSPPWGWWVGQSLVWGISALTTAAIINNAIDRAIDRQQASIGVPNTNWQLYYGSVQPLAETGVTFSVNNGYGNYQMEADCQQGLLNGEVPTSAAEAQLINAACQVTFGQGV
ncbi:MAG: hypothetical protein WD136_07190 [Cyanobium sp.]